MNKYLILISTIILLVSSTIVYSQPHCYPCPIGNPEMNITYTVSQINCGSCTYTVFYEEGCPGIFLIKRIVADNSNPPCCQGTAINDPIVSGYILDAAADTIAAGTIDSIWIYTPSRCWQWEGFLGPGPLHSAVLEPCGTAESCCRYTYFNGVFVRRESFGVQECRNDPEGCFPLCE